jgi:predicted permease
LIAAYSSVVTPGYFEAMRIPLRRGRFFDERDTSQSPAVVIVDERLADVYWPGEDAVGKRMFAPGDGPNLTATTEKTKWFEVVGVVAEVKFGGIVDRVGMAGAFYRVQPQEPMRSLAFALRTPGDAPALSPAVRGILTRLDPELPAFDMLTMRARLDQSVATRRSSMILSGLFGAVALFLSAVGLFGVLAYMVAQRTKEIGIRIALGSPRTAIVRLVLGEGVILVAAGLAVGGVGAAMLTRSLQSQLYEVRASDPAVLTIAALVLALVALSACIIPVRRATGVDPLIALNEEG